MNFSSFANPIEGKRIAKCPDKPNCVSSLELVSDDHYIEPIESRELILQEVKKYIQDHESWKIMEEDENYIHATHTSSLFKFVDDIEFIVIKDKLHFRSASRKGYYDFGANRSRIEKIKKALVK